MLFVEIDGCLRGRSLFENTPESHVELDLALSIEKHLGWDQSIVRPACAQMDIIETNYDLPGYGPERSLWHTAYRSHEIGERPSIHEIHDHRDAAFRDIPESAMDVHNVALPPTLLPVREPRFEILSNFFRNHGYFLFLSELTHLDHVDFERIDMQHFLDRSAATGAPDDAQIYHFL